jgi:hypothetical protein
MQPLVTLKPSDRSTFNIFIFNGQLQSLCMQNQLENWFSDRIHAMLIES